MSTPTTRLRLHDDWAHERLQPNVLVLDYVQHSLDGVTWSEPMPVIRARQQLFETLGLDAIQGYQPWFLEMKGMYPTPKQVWLRYSFESTLSGIDASLLVEKLDQWHVSVNGVPAPSEASSGAWLWDRGFRATPIGSSLRAGVNTIELRSTLQRDLEIEDVFVIGDFGIDLTRPSHPIVTAEPGTLASGDWTIQGYPFYAGGMRYTQTFEVPALPAGRITLRLPRVAASCVLVRIDDSEPQWLGWQPWELDVTGLITTGPVRISLEVHSSLRNAFGPLHRRDSNELLWVGPEEFEEGEAWTDDYVLRPYGVIEGAELVFA